MKYVKVENIIFVFQSMLQDIEDYESITRWHKGDNFKDSILSQLINEEEIGEDYELVQHKLELLDDLIRAIENFEDEQRKLQLNQFKQLELLRIASTYVNKAKSIATGQQYNENSTTDTRACGHPPCSKIFIADPPSKMYCSEKCREKAKKWRKRHGDG